MGVRLSKNNTIPAVLVLTALGFLIYSNTFHSSFHFDDQFAILENGSIRDLLNPVPIWNDFNTRFIVGLTLALNYTIGKYDVFSYHLFNIIFHILASLAVYFLVRLTLKTPAMAPSAFSRSEALAGLFAALVFLTHPIQTQAVTYIWQRAASLATLFYLASLVFYARARLNSSGRDFLLSLICAVFGMFSKETAITLPLAVVLYEFCFFGGAAGNKMDRVRRLAPYFALLPVIPLTLARAGTATLELMRPHAADITRFVSGQEMPRSVYILTQINVIRTYVRLLFFPVRQNLDYDYPLAHSFLEPGTLFSFVFLAAVLAAGAYLFRKNRLASFGIFWFFLTLSIESVVPQHDVIFEHRLYLPMAGFSLFLIGVLFRFFKGKPLVVILAAMMALVSCYSVLTFKRNFVWKDELSLWDDVVRKSPQKARPYKIRSVVYQAAGRLDLALADYDKALAINPRYPEVYNDRGVVYTLSGDLKRALADYDKAIEISPRYASAYNNRGNAYGSAGRLDEAIADFNKAIEINPLYSEAYNNRGNAYGMKGDLARAIADYDKSLEINPNQFKVYSNRGASYHGKGNLDQAILDYTRAIEISPDYFQAYSNRAAAYSDKGYIEQALADCNKAIGLNPGYAEAYNNRGTAWRNKGRYEEAISDFSKAMELNPRYGRAVYNRAVTYFLGKQFDKSWEDVHRIEEMGYNVPAPFLDQLKKESGREK